jgi:hypothetical protein
MRFWVVAGVLLAGIGCRAEIPEGVYVCSASEQCPPGLGCDVVSGLCVRSVPDGGCVAATCEEQRAQCGTVDDRCGGTLECGSCDAPQTCGGADVPNICGCTPRGCEVDECDLVDNGCGAFMDCGGCDAPLECGAGGVANRCGCMAENPCADPMVCGMITDSCGAVQSCEACPSGLNCGGGGPNRCGTDTCIPPPCEDKQCGTISTPCGDVLECGSCTDPETCGGGAFGDRTPGVCGCTPRTCTTSALVRCGTGTEECGTTISCGVCGLNQTCDANQCRCTRPGEPNDVPVNATLLGTLTAPGHVEANDQNFHDDGDTDFYGLQVVSGAGADLGWTVTVQLSGLMLLGAIDVGVWVACPDAERNNPPRCVLPALASDTYLEGGCVVTGAPPLAMAVEVRMIVECSDPMVLVRARNGRRTCNTYRLGVFVD